MDVRSLFTSQRKKETVQGSISFPFLLQMTGAINVIAMYIAIIAISYSREDM